MPPHCCGEVLPEVEAVTRERARHLAHFPLLSRHADGRSPLITLLVLFILVLSNAVEASFYIINIDLQSQTFRSKSIGDLSDVLWGRTLIYNSRRTCKGTGAQEKGASDDEDQAQQDGKANHLV